MKEFKNFTKAIEYLSKCYDFITTSEGDIELLNYQEDLPINLDDDIIVSENYEVYGNVLEYCVITVNCFKDQIEHNGRMYFR